MGRFDLSTEEITTGSIAKSLLLLSIPLLAQSLVSVAQQVIDLFWVGQYSNNAVAAVGLAAPINWLVINITISGPFIATNILVSQRVGADNKTAARRAAFNGLVLSAILGVSVCTALYFNASFLMDFIERFQPGSAESHISELAASYIQVYVLGLIIASLSDAVEANFIAWGDSRATLYMNIAAVSTNLLLDPLLIFGTGPLPRLGIEGAALASAMGSIASLTLGTFFVVKGRTGRIYTLESATIHRGDLRELIDIGAPRSVKGLASNSGSMSMVFVMFTVEGPAGVAAYTIGSRVSALALLSVGSLRSATQSIIGQNLGAGYPDRAATTTSVGATIGLGFLVLIGALQWGYASEIVRALVPKISPKPLHLSVEFLKILSIAYPAGSIISLLKGSFNAARHTKTTMISSLLQTWLVQIPIAIIGGIVLKYGATGVFWARSISIFVASIALGAYYLYKLRSGLFVDAAKVASASGND